MLGWLTAAGADSAVTDAPRNWLAAPPPVAHPSPALAAAIAEQPGRAAAPAVTAPVADLSHIADLAALDAALSAFDHPLRRPGVPPQLLTGNTASGVIVLGDIPHDPASPEAALMARMLAAIGLADTGIGLADTIIARAHLLPWSTPGGRPGRDAEFAAYAPFRARAFSLAAPRLILAFGDRAVGICGQVRGIASSRGKWLSAGEIPLLATFHPRQLLTQPELKRLAWTDLQAFAERLKAQ